MFKVLSLNFFLARQLKGEQEISFYITITVF